MARSGAVRSTCLCRVPATLPKSFWTGALCIARPKESKAMPPIYRLLKGKATAVHINTNAVVRGVRISSIKDIILVKLSLPSISLKIKLSILPDVFMRRDRIPEVPRTGGGLPTLAAQRFFADYAKPLLGALRFVFPPLQPRAVRTFDSLGGDIRRQEFHVRTQFGHDDGLPLFARGLLAFGGQIAHVGDDHSRPPTQVPRTPSQAGHQQSALGHVGWRQPADQRHQRHRRVRRGQPQP